MNQIFKKYPKSTLFVLILSVLFFMVLWSNPSFTDKLWPAAVFGLLLAFITFAFAIIMIILGYVKACFRKDVLYYSAGLSNICLGFFGSVYMISQFFIPGLFCTLPPLLIGLYIFVDIFYFTKRAT